MSTIDYEKVEAADLKMEREPRKSTIKVTHVPTGTVATDPVCPGSLQPARFRRAQNLPKDQRKKDAEGYIEAADAEAEGLWHIIAGDTPKNEYLDALAADPSALKASFEGAPKADKPASSGKKAEVKTDAETGAKTPAGAPAPTPAATTTESASPAEPVADEEIENLLANIE